MMTERLFSGRQVTVLAIVAAMIAAAVGLVVARGPQPYRAVADIQVAGVDSGSSPAVAKNASDNLGALILSPAFRSRVTGSTGVSNSDLAGGLRVAQVGQSNLIEISYSGPRSSKPGKVVEAVAEQAVSEYVSPQIVLLQKQIQVFSQNADSAAGAVSSLYAKSGVLDPPSAYGDVSAQLAQLQTASTLGTAPPGRVQDAISAAERRLKILGALSLKYNNLQTRRASAFEQLSAAQSDLVEAESSQQTVGPFANTGTYGQPVGRGRAAAQDAVLAAALFIVVVGGLVLLLNHRRGRRLGKLRRRRRSSDDSETSSGHAVDISAAALDAGRHAWGEPGEVDPPSASEPAPRT